MAELKKCWRQKVVAEMTAIHLQQFAREMGASLSTPDALVFLNEQGRAYEMWQHMMRAGEQYIKAKLQESYRLPGARHAAPRMQVLRP
ncbi:MAG TPA: hypothetical protein VGR48_16665 [Terriglobales bacterium]|nr:hypothetical protein [Terriglobales bacterium]